MGTEEVETAMEVCLSLINAQRAKVAGIKLSLLDAAYEITLCRKLPSGVRIFTGDDFNYVDLIVGASRATATPC